MKIDATARAFFTCVKMSGKVNVLNHQVLRYEHPARLVFFANNFISFNPFFMNSVRMTTDYIRGENGVTEYIFVETHGLYGGHTAADASLRGRTDGRGRGRTAASRVM